MSFRFTFTGMEEVKGYRCARIESSGDNELLGESTIFFAIEEGFVVKEEIVSPGFFQDSLTGELTRRKRLTPTELKRVQREAQHAGAWEFAGSEASTGDRLVGQLAPDFQLLDLEGNATGLTDFKGRVVLLNFWVSWYQACTQLTPHFNELHDKYKNRDVAILGIAFESEAERAIGLVESVVLLEQLDYPVLRGNGEVFQAYDLARALPTTFLIDRDGRIERAYRGYRPLAQLGADIQALINEEREP